jgi:PKHD-type hydroxylase
MSHNYKTIWNNPVERQVVIYPWCYWDNAFNEDELKKMCDYFSQEILKDGIEEAKVRGKNERPTADGKTEEVRVSDVKFFLYNEETKWIFERINFVIENINNSFYNFDLNGYNSFQYTEYDGEKTGKYDFHMDTFLGTGEIQDGEQHECRKLSLTMLLNEQGVDFEGGDFQINQGREDVSEIVPTKKGRIILFPSFLIHRVTPVTKGKRKSLVTWIEGPKFK